MVVEDLPSGVQTRQGFASALTLLREHAGLTIRDVARLSGASASTLGGYFSGRHMPPLSQPELLEAVLQACGVDSAQAVAAWRDALGRARRAPGPRPADQVVPYRGLESYRTRDAEWFFGRADAVTAVVDAVTETAAGGGGLVVVVGASGAGKTSLLQAGVAPALTTPPAPARDVVWMTPGEHPMARLVELGLAEGGHAGDTPHVERGTDGAGCGAVVLMVDQFEELFTQCCSPQERVEFIRVLTEDRSGIPAGRDTAPGSIAASGPLVVIAGLRADFYRKAVEYGLLSGRQDRQVVVGAMSADQVREAIQAPARKAHLDLEPGLVDVLVADLTGTQAPLGGYEPGALPLLSHALLATWERSRRGRMTLADYAATGGIRGAVAETAEHAFKNLTPSQREAARLIFRRLVTVSQDTADTRRCVSWAELELDQFPDDYGAGSRQDGQPLTANDTDAPPDPGRDARTVVEVFAACRLLTLCQDGVEITHETLLTAWPRLQEWVDSDRSGLRTHRLLTADAAAWADHGRDPSLLYRGTRLEAAANWAADRPIRELNPTERTFLDAGLDQQRREQHAQARRTSVLRRLVAALTVAAITATGLAVLGFRLRGIATHERDLALSRQVAAAANRVRRTDAALAAQLALTAYRISPTPEARAALLDTSATHTPARLLGPPGVMQSVVASPDGRYLAGGGEAGTVRLWTRTAPGHEGTLTQTADLSVSPGQAVFAVAFSPDSALLAAAGADRTVYLWNLRAPSPTPLPALTGPGNTVYGLAFAPRSRLLAAASADKTVHLWDLSDPAHPRPVGQPLAGPTDFVQAIAFRPDGQRLAAGSADGKIYQWNLPPTSTAGSAPTSLAATGMPSSPPPLTGPTSTVFAVTYSPDGRTLAAGSRDGKVYRWTTDTTGTAQPRALRVLTGPTSWVNALAFSPDATALSAGSSDNQLWTWSLRTRRVTTLRPHPGAVTAVTYINGGATLLTAAADGTARLWPVPGPATSGLDGVIYQLAYDAAGTVLAAASNANELSLWDTRTRGHLISLSGPVHGPSPDSTEKLIGSAASSPDGRILATGTRDGRIHLWDTTNPAAPTLIGVPLVAGTKTVESVKFSPDGKTLAAGGDDTTLTLWNVTNPKAPTPLAPPLPAGTDNYIYSLAFTPDGRTLAAGTANRIIWLWDLTDLTHPTPLGKPLAGSTSYVFSVAINPRGTLLAGAGADKTIRLWDITDRTHPRPIGNGLAGATNYVNVLDFSPDGRTLAAGGEDHTIWLYDLTDPRRVRPITALNAIDDRVVSLTFNPKEQTLIAGSTGQLRTWDTSANRIATSICATASDVITPTEWDLYLPSTPYQPPCSR